MGPIQETEITSGFRIPLSESGQTGTHAATGVGFDLRTRCQPNLLGAIPRTQEWHRTDWSVAGEEREIKTIKRSY